jgi:hypothetical protein
MTLLFSSVTVIASSLFVDFGADADVLQSM